MALVAAGAYEVFGATVTIPVSAGSALRYNCLFVQSQVTSIDQMVAVSQAAGLARQDAEGQGNAAFATSIAGLRRIHDWPDLEDRTVKYLCRHRTVADAIAAGSVQ